MKLFLLFIFALLGAGGGSAVLAQDCRQRGDLDAAYCDENGDLTADPPKDARRLRDPATLLYSYSPFDDPAVYERMYKPFIDHLRSCTGRKVTFFQVHSSAAAVEAMRSGRMHIGAFGTGDTGYAVNVAGAVPFATRGDASGVNGYRLIVVVRADQPYRALADLKGRRVAHTAPSSHSGNLAPRALFPAQGLTPDRDYKVLFSGKHDHSVMGVKSADYDAAAIADDAYDRMIVQRLIKPDEMRVIYRSAVFPGGGLSLVHDLVPALAQKIRDCSYAYRYTEEMKKAYGGSDRWVPINYREHWELVRSVAAAGGETFTRQALDRKAAAGAQKK